MDTGDHLGSVRKGPRVATVPSFTQGQLRSICDVLGETQGGLTNREIDQLLVQCGIVDCGAPGSNKRDRLFAALHARQEQDRCGNNVAAFIVAAMAPVRFANLQPGYYDDCRHRLNKPLAFCGYQINEAGQLLAVTAARTLTEAERRADLLRGELQRRNVHSEVLRFCRPELLTEDYFHAVLEATKSVAQKIRDRTGLSSDGSSLVEDAFRYAKPGFPVLAINSLQNDSDENEHRGFANLLKGTFQMFRNPTAHDPRIRRHVTEQEALDLLSIVSFLHRRLDDAVPTCPLPQYDR